MDLDIICAFIKKNGKDLGEIVESNAKKGEKQSLTVILDSLINIREHDMQDMGERGIHHDDFPDKEIGIDGYSITDMIHYVEDLINQQKNGGGKRNTRKATKRPRKSHTSTKRHRKATKRSTKRPRKSRKPTKRRRVNHR